MSFMLSYLIIRSMFLYTSGIKKVLCDTSIENERELSFLLRLVSDEVFREAEMRG